jgi:hypothetical protein
MNEDLFAATYQALRAKLGEPRSSISSDIKREWFELEDGQVIMFATPLRKPDPKE